MRRQVVEVQCTRCSRQELVAEAEKNSDRSFTAVLGGETVGDFEDLCTPCFNTIQKALETLCKKITGLSPERGAKKEKKVVTPIPIVITDPKMQG